MRQYNVFIKKKRIIFFILNFLFFGCSNDIPIDEANVQNVKQQINTNLRGVSQAKRKVLHEIASDIEQEIIDEINRIKSLTKEERINELGLDPIKNKVDLYEGEIGHFVEANYGFFKRYTTSVEGDFVSINGFYKEKIFDTFGLPENVTTYPNYDITKFYPSIDKHFLNKPNVDYLILDMCYMNLAQKAVVNQYLNNNFSNQLSRLIKIE